MKTKQITLANADGLIRQLYETAFPEGEQIPWDDLMRLVEDMPLDFTAYYDDEEVMEQREQSQACLEFAESRQNSTEGRFIGFTIVYLRPSYNWFWYFAVREELRGKGFGQQILTLLIERYKEQTCVLDMEAVEQQIPSKRFERLNVDGLSDSQILNNLEQRKRRHAFYLRNGFRDTCLYRTYNDITMTIMMRGEGTFTMKDWDKLVGELKKFWWPDDISES
ncbi:MAG: GNAT family N-acetyltransferase [Prevotella sp.]|nr:GNAT family N-acetyltransferase [Prevotella sp.]